jgi:hypothetical protein
MQIAAMNPVALNKEGVSHIKPSKGSKPLEGCTSLAIFFGKNLPSQSFVKDYSMTIAQ